MLDILNKSSTTKKIQVMNKKATTINMDQSFTIKDGCELIIKNTYMTNENDFSYIKKRLSEILYYKHDIKKVSEEYINIFNKEVKENNYKEYMYGRARKQSNLFLLRYLK